MTPAWEEKKITRERGRHSERPAPGVRTSLVTVGCMDGSTGETTEWVGHVHCLECHRAIFENSQTWVIMGDVHCRLCMDVYEGAPLPGDVIAQITEKYINEPNTAETRTALAHELSQELGQAVRVDVDPNNMNRVVINDPPQQETNKEDGKL